MKEYKISKEVLDFFEQNGSCVMDGITPKYFFFPYWIEKTGSGTVRLHSLESMPEALKSLLEAKRNEKEYEIWSEGYAAQGNSGTAHYYGKARGATFRNACYNFRYPEDIYNFDGTKMIKHKGDTLDIDGGAELTVWGCRLFDNEEDARKSFG